MSTNSGRARPLKLPALIISMLLPLHASALPSFADQTGQPCSSCHMVAFGPGLTPYGMQFKLEGYVASDGPRRALPLAAMQLSSFTNTRAAQPGGAAPGFRGNNNVAADQTSIFYAGRISDHVGAFVQATNDGVAHQTAWDNLDIRYADHGPAGAHNVAWGISLNNNPTVQDLWNTTPAWGFPFAGSPLAPSPAAAPLLEGALAQEVGGLSAYTLLDNWLYLEAGAYRMLSARTQSNLGMAPDGETTLKGAAPYWRASLQHFWGGNYTSIGVFGMSARLNPGGDTSAGSDAVDDSGYDASYQYNDGGDHRFFLNATYLHERQDLAASVALGDASVARNDLNTLRVSAGWVYRQTWSFSGGYFNIDGGSDSTVYAPGDISGSANGSPDSRGFIHQVEYIPFGKGDSPLRPWLNLRLGLQFVAYSRFNGGKSNYDGSGRNAGDNNTLYVFMWWAL